jgi:hypothetical protein
LEKVGANVTLITDPSKEGFENVLRGYQIESLKHIWRHKEDSLTFRDAFKDVKRGLVAGKSVSRTSIINFLYEMCDEGVLKYEEETCRGGMRRKYLVGLVEADFKRYIAATVLKSFYEKLSLPDQRGNKINT